MNSNSSSNNEFIAKLTNIVEVNLTHPQFGVSMLARELGMSRSHLHRKVKSISNVSVSQLIREIRLNLALELLNQSHISASDVADKVGFGSATYFNKCFHDYFGCTPGEVGKRDIKPIKKIASVQQSVKSKTRLYSIALFFFLIVFIQFTIIYFVFKPFSFSGKKKNKTIVVLPITVYNNSNEENLWAINALRDDLISKLEIIENLHVVSRTTSDLFLGKQKNIKELSKIFNAHYILEGSWQQYEQRIKIQFQLIDTKTGDFLWSKPFVREIGDDDFLSFQDEVALLVIKELNTVVSKREKEQIQIPQTNNLAAYNFYHQGKNFMEAYKQMPGSNFSHTTSNYFIPLEFARTSFENALELDSIYSKVYVDLGWYYHIKSEVFIFDAVKSDMYLDSALFMAEKAISFNSDLADAYDLQSCIYAHKGTISKSQKSSDKLISLNQNNWKTYYRVADNYKLLNMNSRAARYFLIAKELNIEPLENINTIKGLCSCFLETGFIEEAKLLVELLLKQENDSIDYFSSLAHIEFSIGNLDQALQHQLKAHALDNTNTDRLLTLSLIHLTMHNEEDMYKYFNLYQTQSKNENTKITPNKYAGYIYSLMGNTKEANHHFNEVLKSNKKRLELQTSNHFSFSSSYEIACIYSSTGQHEKAIQYLSHYKKQNSCPLWLITSLKNNPMLNNIRNSNEFQDILQDLDIIFRAERLKTEKIITQEGTIQS